MNVKFNMIRMTLGAHDQSGNVKFRKAYAQMRAEQANADAADARGARHDLVSRVVPAVSETCGGDEELEDDGGEVVRGGGGG